MSKDLNSGDPHALMMVGGQAVIEGVMMRAQGRIATAVRRADGTIVVRHENFTPLAKRYPALGVPIFRGAFGIIEMLLLGIRTLNFSAEIAMADEKGTAAAPETKRKESKVALGFTVAMALGLGIALFFVTPLVLTSLAFSVDQNPVLFNALAGTIRLVLFLGYLGLIAQMKDVKRLFAYHGAEHKTVFAYESGAPLTVETAACQSRFHPRCGTSFLLVVMLSSVILFALVDGLLILQFGRITLPLRLLTHLPLIPLVGGLSYEFIRLSARLATDGPGRWIVAPGLWLQKITTREPDASQLEVAIAALRAALEPAGEHALEPVTPAVAEGA
jgi:uncharacterized protein YqhQ